MKEPQPPAIGVSNSPSAFNAAKPLRFLVIGAGSRGTAYARAVTTTTSGVIHAVAEPHAFKRQEFGRSFIWTEKDSPQEGQEFNDWQEWLQWELKRRQQNPLAAQPPGVDGVFICTLDETHIEILQAIAPLQLHVLCEKPLALSLDDCLTAYRVFGGLAPSTIFSIGHVLRYSPHNILLRKLLLVDRVIGDIVSLEHCEPVGWWHFAHSYVRGNWRRQTPAGDGSLLTKSCHDIDFILWLLCSPLPPSEDDATEITENYSLPHLPRSISSTGALTQFRPARKPATAGTATNCLSCPAEQDCNYSALKIYRDLHVKQSIFDWPVNIVCPDIEDVVRPALAATPSDSDATKSAAVEAAETHLLRRLGEDYSRENMTDEEIAARPWYGRCVYDGDNTVCDDQIVTITWDDEQPSPPSRIPTSQHPLRTAKTASFHMIAPTEKQCERRGRVYGTHGEISYDSRTISIYSFATRSTTTVEVPRQPPEEEKSHGGGDYGLARSFVRAVDAVVNDGWEVQRAQRHFVGCTLEEAVRSHAVVFAAEEARRDEKVVKWKEWWEEKVRQV
ncbi:NAD binding Rossmann fold oxidoreductase [Aspergillus steynii IBT 23096]|uniref:NAD binding Rossmann fold oxidoreductase n=1 Tax=Aspergillus steynii IBT 23096 TaxID=1392250 RepID=A0A2I2GIW4_9EURO|nr:NAD binding Rossmann fold oxidoreductase [Aspergillus steynii IBT 23096]PLB52820.1 NAD binding Rossmann fold oxidoreductase [Aspergillus steynii IBT 23096]